MKILRRAACLMTAVVLVISLVLPVTAQTTETGLEIRTETVEGLQYRVITGTGEQVRASMNYFSSVFSSIDPQSGKIDLGGVFVTKSDIPVNFTLTVERSTNNSSWTAVSGQSWTESYNALAYAAQPMYRTYANPAKNYYYRTNAYAEYRVNGILHEGVRAYSSGVRYPKVSRSTNTSQEPIYEIYQLVK